ncbi:MAG: hypothetical protein RMK80_09350, partial [Pseudobdellovibrionaceae bacterium]|nr:hypothetical protein [Pseudobdellovibrionaceae bacterium]
HFKKKTKLFWLKPTTLALLFGDFLLTGNLGKVILPGGNVLITNTDSLAMVQIDKESVVLKVYQGEVTISQVQPALKLRLGPFQEVRWTKGQWGIPTHIVLLRSVVADWQGFPRRASKLLERVFSAGGLKASAHELGFVYRSIAQAYQDQREAKYRKILDDQKRGERKRQQLKYWFRQRVFDPLRWEQFWNSPQLDDQ